MHRNRFFLAAATCAAVGLTPASALAAGSVVVGPLQVKGYQLTVSASDGGSADSLSVNATKTSGKSTQMHTWSFDQGVSVSVSAAKATIKGSLGRYGSINASVAGGRTAKGVVPKGCKGKAGSVRTGKLAGTAKLALDSSFFKTVSFKGAKAQLLKGGKLDCSGAGNGGSGTPGGSASGLTFSSTVDGDAGQLMVSATKQGAKVDQQVMRMDTATATAPASVMHMISAETGASGLDAAADLSTASLAGAGPFLSGTLTFAGEAMGDMATGETGGQLTAKFDSIGAQPVPAGTSAMLMRR